MLERLIDNWLDSASERSFQSPFCQILASQGYTVVHSTRHCGMELGKDIIAISPDGIPCAYQLKAGNISHSKWRDIQSQIKSLVDNILVHRSLKIDAPHKSFLVTNGRIDEEVMRDIEEFNRQQIVIGKPDSLLDTIVGGQLKRWALDVGDKIWPSELVDFRDLLEFYLLNGRDTFQVEKFVSLLLKLFPVDPSTNTVPSMAQCRRILSSTALLTAISIKQYVEEKNYVAQITAWTIFLATSFALIDRASLPKKNWNNTINIVIETIFRCLENLWEEINNRDLLVEGNAIFEETTIYRVRVTILVSLMSIFGLWGKSMSNELGESGDSDETDDAIWKFCSENYKKLFLWGEGSVPQWLAFFWYSRQNDATLRPEFFLTTLVELVCRANTPRGGGGLTSPYYSADKVLRHILQLDIIEDNFVGRSHVLEGLLYMAIRRNWKRKLKMLWPEITRISLESFTPPKKWQFYLWYCDKGLNKSVRLKHYQLWEELLATASEEGGSMIPRTIKGEPILLLLFLQVFPHRFTADVARWIDTRMMELL